MLATMLDDSVSQEDQSTRNEQIQKALDFAANSHRMQFRKGLGVPYLTHPLAVLNQIADWGVTNIVVWQAAILHDVPEEDLTVTFPVLYDTFGEDVASIVKELTFIPPASLDPEAKARLKKGYMESFDEKSVEALVIKSADRIINTLDWLSTQPDYAAKYWKKGEPLFDAMMSRGEEILLRFGEAVFPRMKYSRTYVGRMLY